jgi:hypothetical protein
MDAATALVAFLTQEQQQWQQHPPQRRPLFQLLLDKSNQALSPAAAHAKVAAWGSPETSALYSLLPGLVDRLVSQVVGQQVQVVLDPPSRQGYYDDTPADSTSGVVAPTTCAAFLQRCLDGTRRPFCWMSPGDADRHQQYHFMAHLAADLGVEGQWVLDNYAGVEVCWPSGTTGALSSLSDYELWASFPNTWRCRTAWRTAGGLKGVVPPDRIDRVLQEVEASRAVTPNGDQLSIVELAQRLHSSSMGSQGPAGASTAAGNSRSSSSSTRLGGASPSEQPAAGNSGSTAGGVASAPRQPPAAATAGGGFMAAHPLSASPEVKQRHPSSTAAAPPPSPAAALLLATTITPATVAGAQWLVRSLQGQPRRVHNASGPSLSCTAAPAAKQCPTAPRPARWHTGGQGTRRSVVGARGRELRGQLQQVSQYCLMSV